MAKGERKDERKRFGDKVRQYWKNLRGKEHSLPSNAASASEAASSDIVTIASNLPVQIETSLKTPSQNLPSTQVEKGALLDLGLWGKAADNLGPVDREKLDALVQSNRETLQRHREDSQSSHFGLEHVLALANDLKGKENEATRTRVSLPPP